MTYKHLTTKELIEYVKNYNFTRDIKEYHVHHTWMPNHDTFKVNGHYETQMGMYDYHTKTLGWSDIGQHVTLFPDGTWGLGRDFNKIPASIKGRNTGSFAMEMVGNFDIGKDKFEGVQKESVLEFMNFFLDFMGFGYEGVVFHRESSSKTCPGSSIDKDVFINDLRLKKEGEIMSERIDIRIRTSGKIIEDLEKDTIEKVHSYLDLYEVVQKEERLYQYVGYPLKKGMYNNVNNSVLQGALKELGYYNMPIDNHFGEGMHSAIIQLEIDRNLDVTGIVTERVADEINKALIEKRNKAEEPIDTSEFDNFKPLVKLIKPFGYYTKFGQTRPVQFALNEIDSVKYDIEVDGHFGRGTQSALNTYKKSKGLLQDGLVDELTWKHLHFDLWKKQENEDLKINWYDNQAKVVRVKKSDVDMDVIMGQGAVESVPSIYRRLDEKPMVIFNGGLFAMSNGNTMSLTIDEGKEITFGYFSKWMMSQTFDGELKLRGGHWEKQIGNYGNIKEAIGASPSLVINGEKNVDKTGLDNGFVVHRHPRIAFCYDDEYVYIIVVHGRNSLKGYYGANIDELVEICLDLGVKNGINLDGGGSITLLDGNGNRIDDNTSVRRVDNAIALYKKQS